MAIVNFSKKDIEGQEYLPEGESVCTVTKVEEIPAKSGSDMVVVTLADRLGRTARENFVLTEKALFRLARFAKACGFQPGEIENGFDTNRLRGRKVVVIKTFSGMRTGNDGREYKDYEHSFGKVEKGSDAGAPASSSAPTAGGEFNSDEIPF